MGVKLYDKASDVVSEIISNSYDADAEKIIIEIPLDKYLATRQQGIVRSKNYKIMVEDDGHGFTAKEANTFFLKVGSNRRQDSKRGSHGTKSKEHGRSVMGRKGIGKLAAFGICKKIEVWSAAGKKNEKDYKISHFIMDYDEITKDTDKTYHPQPGNEDGKLSKTRGTKIILSDFHFKKIPNKEIFMRQLARKFGVKRDDFEIKIHDIVTKKSDTVSTFNIDLLDDTKILVDNRPVCLENDELQVRGWVAYAKTAYKNEEMVGVRIYAKGKLAAVTRDFGHISGFTGEFTIRSYLVGEIYADWLDEDDDLIASDRQDILWSSEKGTAFKEWGQKLLDELGKKSTGPVRKKRFDEFKKISHLEDRAKEKFGDTHVYDVALEVGKGLASNITEQSLTNINYVEGLLELILSVAPHKMIVDKLKKIADGGNQNALDVISSLFGDAKLAETASLGQIAYERIRVIKELSMIISQTTPVAEPKVQDILLNAPWLIEPQWTVLQDNKSFNEFKRRFTVFCKRNRHDVLVPSINPELGRKRPDFIMLPIRGSIEIIEIKPPGHTFNNVDYERLHNYYEVMEQFVNEPDMLRSHYEYHIVLICDDVNLKKVAKTSYDRLVEIGILSQKTWEILLSNTRQAHEDFLKFESNVFRKSD